MGGGWILWQTGLNHTQPECRRMNEYKHDDIIRTKMYPPPAHTTKQPLYISNPYLSATLWDFSNRRRPISNPWFCQHKNINNGAEGSDKKVGYFSLVK